MEGTSRIQRCQLCVQDFTGKYTTVVNYTQVDGFATIRVHTYVERQCSVGSTHFASWPACVANDACLS